MLILELGVVSGIVWSHSLDHRRCVCRKRRGLPTQGMAAECRSVTQPQQASLTPLPRAVSIRARGRSSPGSCYLVLSHAWHPGTTRIPRVWTSRPARIVAAFPRLLVLRLGLGCSLGFLGRRLRRHGQQGERRLKQEGPVCEDSSRDLDPLVKDARMRMIHLFQLYLALVACFETALNLRKILEDEIHQKPQKHHFQKLQKHHISLHDQLLLLCML